MANTALNFKWGKSLAANSPALQAGTVYVATEERAMYVDAVVDGSTKRIRLGDIIFKEKLSDLATDGDWTESALYYIEEKNALVKWDADGGENGAGAWKIINDTASLSSAITANATAISENASNITTLGNRVTTVENSLAADGAIGTRLGTAEGKISTLEGKVSTAEGKISAAEDKITGLETTVEGKADTSALNTLSETVNGLSSDLGELTTTVATNKSDAAAATKTVADDLAAYKELNDGVVSGHESKLTSLETQDTELSNRINAVDKKFEGYVTTTTHSGDVSRLEGLISTAQQQADKGVADAAAAKKQADKGVNDASAAQTTANNAVTAAATADGKAVAAQEGVNDLVAVVYGDAAHKPTDKTIVEMIADAKSEATYDDTEVRGLITSNTTLIGQANGRIDAIVENATIKTFKGIEEDLAAVRREFAAADTGLDGKITSAANAASKAQGDVNTLSGDFEAYKTSNNSAVSALQTTVGEHTTAIAGKVSQSDFNTLSGTVSGHTTTIGEHATAIASKVAQSDFDKLEEIVEGHGTSITGIDTRLQTAEGTLKTTVETTIPALTGRVKSLEDGMSGYVTEGELSSTVTTLEGKIKTAQDKADKGVNDASAAQTTANKAQADATSALNQLTAIKDSQTIDSFKDVEDAIKAGFAANDAMVFKGVLNQESDLPAAAEANSGHTYKVATAGSYNGQVAKVGDLFISDGSAWVWVPSGDEARPTVGLSVTDGNNQATLNVSGQEINPGSEVVLKGSDSISVEAASGTITIGMFWGEF